MYSHSINKKPQITVPGCSERLPDIADHGQGKTKHSLKALRIDGICKLECPGHGRKKGSRGKESLKSLCEE